MATVKLQSAYSHICKLQMSDSCSQTLIRVA